MTLFSECSVLRPVTDCALCWWLFVAVVMAIPVLALYWCGVLRKRPTKVLHPGIPLLPGDPHGRLCSQGRVLTLAVGSGDVLRFEFRAKGHKGTTKAWAVHAPRKSHSDSSSAASLKLMGDQVRVLDCG